MTSLDTTTSPHSQWVPSEYKLCLQLDNKSTKSRIVLFSLLNEDFTFPATSTFTIVATAGKTIRVLVSIHNVGTIRLNTCSNLQTVSTTCSKLNMANALHCKITARMIENDILCFSIIPLNATMERGLLKFFSIYED